MSRHVVFGTGQIGRAVVSRLVADGQQVVAVNRSGRGQFPGAQLIGADATDPTVTTAICADADVVYFCLNAVHYAQWAAEFPPLQRGVLAGAERAGARLVVLDNLYAYGPPHGGRLVETMTANPTSAKATTRAAMTAELLEAHRTGRVDVAVGRASDYFGPGTTRSALGDSVFGAALRGGRAQVMGDPDTLHSYSYSPDVATGLITLGSAPEAGGRVWHLPVVEACTTRRLVEQVYALSGHRPRLLAAGRTTLGVLGLVMPELREYRHTLYQFSAPWVVDDSAFRSAFGWRATPLPAALASTVDWYRGRAPVTVARANHPPTSEPSNDIRR